MEGSDGFGGGDSGGFGGFGGAGDFGGADYGGGLSGTSGGFGGSGFGGDVSGGLGSDFGGGLSDLGLGLGWQGQYGYDGAIGTSLAGVYGPADAEGESWGGIGSFADAIATARAKAASPWGRAAMTALSFANPAAGLFGRMGLGLAGAARGNLGPIGSTVGGVLGSAAGPLGGMFGGQFGGAIGRGLSGLGLGSAEGPAAGPGSGGGDLMNLIGGLYGLSQARSISKQAGLPSSDVTQLPGYQAGLQAVERRMKAQGYQGSGNMMAALSKYGGDFYNQAVNQRIASSQARMNPLVAQLSALGLLKTGLPALGSLFGGFGGGGSGGGDGGTFSLDGVWPFGG